MPSRLRSRTGCQTCLQRRKKCDERRPTCALCHQLGLQCEWRPVTADQPAETVTVRSGVRPPAAEPLETTRTTGEETDSVAQALVPVDHRTLHDSLRGAQNLPTLNTDFSRAFDEHVMINGILLGWPAVFAQFELDPQWQQIIAAEQHVQRVGQTLVCRLAIIIYLRLISKILFSRVNEHLALVPAWYQPQPFQLTGDYPSSLHYIPWPGLRKHVAQDPGKYCTNAWMTEHLTHFRFVWSLPLADAVEWNPKWGTMSYSTAFRDQHQDIWSWRLTSDYLNKYPAFRAYAPQFEQSLTTYRLSDHLSPTDLLALLREAKRRDRIETRSVRLSRDRLADWVRIEPRP